MSRTVDELDAERIADDIEIASWDEDASKAILAEAVLDKIEREKEAKEAGKDDLSDPTTDDLETDFQEALNVLSDARLLLMDLADPQYHWRLPEFLRKGCTTVLEEISDYLDDIDEGEETTL